ncbi:hypothetical protein [Rhizobium sp. CSW-27]|uniref:hypothetical protein n=1 Tax=Rhizobium sp. CSW-27 TaxID=2839985 RepID=UPI001C03085B|nr:hypothetical protein [Rhizobium sp. CSW-27]MBT9370281.1 hypothetical protein [Rhizobium sp. CSW-27]
MADEQEWKVLRAHDGDRWYAEGETRIGTTADLGHLAPRTLERIGPAKAAATLRNKAAPPLENKSSTNGSTRKPR